jgi:hypothetical protein
MLLMENLDVAWVVGKMVAVIDERTKVALQIVLI